MIKKIAVSVAALSATLFAYQAYAQTVETTVEQARSDTQNWREVDPENLLLFKTTKGDIYIELAPEVAPNHVAQVRRIVRTGLYSGTQFHRVISDFMAQGGDIEKVLGRAPNIEPVNGEFYFRRDPSEMKLKVIKEEDRSKSQYTGYYKGFPIETAQDARASYTNDGRVEAWMPHCAGITSMARTNDPNSASDQFFLMREESSFLNRQYSSWGRMVKGLDVARSLAVGEPPLRPDILVSAQVVADMPEATRPRAWVMRVDGPAFDKFLDDNGRDTSICDLPQVPAVVDTGSKEG